MVVLHHVNLGVPEGGVEGETRFLVDLLGFRPLAGPEGPGGRAHWFEGDDGKQIHLSEDPDHRPAARAHVAVELGGGLSALEARLEERGIPFRTFDVGGRHTAFCQDPAGNAGSSAAPTSGSPDRGEMGRRSPVVLPVT